MSDKDYSDVIDADDYTQGLAEHPDIPQADAGIIRLIRENLISKEGSEYKILDLGCGPGRLTKLLADDLSLLARQKRIKLDVTGLDISKGFIAAARKKRNGEVVSYIEADFLTHEFGSKLDVILMQGLFHHVSLEQRQAWLEKCRDLLREDGIVVIGDEFVPDYSTPEERVQKVAGLYAYVVAYALQNKNQSLAQIESMNMVDDVCAGLPGAGHSNEQLIRHIQDTSVRVYECLYQKGVQDTEYGELLRSLVCRIQGDAANLAVGDDHSHDRGDYKISMKKQVEELENLGLKLEQEQVHGPVHWVGGMGVMSFKKAVVKKN